MGDKANLRICEGKDDNGVYLYSHWDGYKLPSHLQKALKKKWCWDDCPYLTRIIFDVITEGQSGEETGFGISAFCGDGARRVLVINCDKQEVSYLYKNERWSFTDYIALSAKEIENIWDN